MNSKLTRYVIALALVVSGATFEFAQSGGPVARFTATTANTSSSGETVRLDLLRWSTDMERDQLSTAAGTSDNALATALQRAPTIGYIWTSESAGYSVKYAYRIAMPDGSQRIIVATDRLLGTYEPQRWKISGAAKATDYAFTIVELRIPKTGPGEGKTSLVSKVMVDKDAKTIALADYPASPLILQGVKP